MAANAMNEPDPSRDDTARERDDEAMGSILEEEPEVSEAAESGALENLMDGIEGSGDDQVSVEDVLATFEHRSVGALVSVFALLAALPIVGGIPGMSIGTATLILLILGQSLIHRRGGIWIPGVIARRKIKKETIENGVEKARPYVRRVDRWMHPRLEPLTCGRPQRLAMVVAMVVMTLTFYPLAFIPWGVTAPALGVLALGLAMLTGDGYLALFGYAMIAATVLTGILLL